MEKTHERPSLVTLVEEGNTRHLLCYLRSDEDILQSELDEALHMAVRCDQVLAVRILVAAGADMYAHLNGNDHISILTMVIMRDNIYSLQMLLDEGFDINKDSSDVTRDPLRLAIMAQRSPGIVKMLLEAGRDAEARDVDGDTPLILASIKGNPDVVQVLLSAGVKVNWQGSESNTALHAAAFRGHVKVAQVLMQNKADPNILNERRDTPFLLACEKGHLPMVEMLLPVTSDAVNHVNLEGRGCLHQAALSDNTALIGLLVAAGAQPALRDKHGNTALITACLKGNEEFAAALVAKVGEKVDARVTGEVKRTALHWAVQNGLTAALASIIKLQGSAAEVNTQDAVGDTAVILAVKNQEIDAFQCLVQQCECDMNLQGELGRTALHWASLYGHIHFVEVLLGMEHGLNMDVQDELRNTPLQYAAINQNCDVMEKLLSKGAAVNGICEGGRSILHWVCEAGNFDMVLQLVTQRAPELDIIDTNGDTPLLLAVKCKHERVVALMVKAGADVNIKDHIKKTALHYASAEGEVGMVIALVGSGRLQSDVRDDNDNTPLLLASIQSQTKVMGLLLGLSCQVNAVGKAKRTALYYMASMGCCEIIKLLLNAGAKPDVEQSESSPLIQASKNGHGSVVTMLLHSGADINRRDSLHHRTALMWAAQNGHINIMMELLDVGADAKVMDQSGDTALTLAAFHGHSAALTLLLPLSDFDHCENEEGMGALHLAIAKNHKACVEVLLAAGASVQVADHKGNNALLCAVVHTNGCEIMELILKSGQSLDIDFHGDQSRAAIHWAVGDPECVEMLLGYSPSLDVVDGNGASPLLLAIAHEQPASARLLIEAGCDINQLHSDGRHPIHHAVIYGDIDTTALLLSHHVDPDTPMEDGRCPLVLAAIEGHAEISSLLIQHGCTINRVYFDAFSALSLAASNRHYVIVDLLLEAGADPNLIGCKKHYPLLHCVLKDDLYGVMKLLQGGAHAHKETNIIQHPIHVAAIKSNTAILHLLAAVENNMRIVRKILQDEGFNFLVSSENLAMLTAVSRSPRSMKMLCRQAVRENLRLPIKQSINNLHMPRRVKDYLALKDLEEVWLGQKNV